VVSYVLIAWDAYIASQAFPGPRSDQIGDRRMVKTDVIEVTRIDQIETDIRAQFHYRATGHLSNGVFFRSAECFVDSLAGKFSGMKSAR